MDAELMLKRQASFDYAGEREIANWIEEVLGKPLSSKDLSESLKSGEVLCELINVIKPGLIPKINRKSIMLMEVENIKLYLSACSLLGVPSSDLFVASDLYEKKSMNEVMQNIRALNRRAASLSSYSGPLLPSTPRSFSNSSSPNILSTSSSPLSSSMPISGGGGGGGVMGEGKREGRGEVKGSWGRGEMERGSWGSGWGRGGGWGNAPPLYNQADPANGDLSLLRSEVFKLQQQLDREKFERSQLEMKLLQQTSSMPRIHLSSPSSSSSSSSFLAPSNSSPHSSIKNEHQMGVRKEIARKLWEEDGSSDRCSRCRNIFSFFTRRHHCRLCGKLFDKKVNLILHFNLTLTDHRWNSVAGSLFHWKVQVELFPSNEFAFFVFDLQFDLFWCK